MARVLDKHGSVLVRMGIISYEGRDYGRMFAVGRKYAMMFGIESFAQGTFCPSGLGIVDLWQADDGLASLSLSFGVQVMKLG